MAKLEQIQNLCIEWQKENTKKRAICLIGIEIDRDKKNDYSTSYMGVIQGCEYLIVDYLAEAITNNDVPLHCTICKAIKKVAMCGFMKRIGSIAEEMIEIIKDFEGSAKSNNEVNN